MASRWIRIGPESSDHRLISRPRLSTDTIDDSVLHSGLASVIPPALIFGSRPEVDLEITGDFTSRPSASLSRLSTVPRYLPRSAKFR